MYIIIVKKKMFHSDTLHDFLLFRVAKFGKMYLVIDQRHKERPSILSDDFFTVTLRKGLDSNAKHFYAFQSRAEQSRAEQSRAGTLRSFLGRKQIYR